MRKYIKKQLIQMLMLLKEAETALKKSYENANIVDLLTQMQETAISIGNEIEQSEGSNIPVIGLLEEYCELLWQCCQAQNRADKARLVKLIMKKNLQIDRGIKHDIEEQYTALFLPYKASMWDSMESIWYAAKNDPKCKAIVMPIPYFDKNPDGSFNNFYYEGDMFPQYVPIADYKTTNLAEIYPDFTYIHNPYDEFNFVTSIHPDYYMNELHKNTETVIYVPYFVCTDTIREESCVVKGVIRSDLVMVQSDAIRREYIKYIKYIFQNIFDTNKILSLGSPKFDKVIKQNNSKSEISEEWKERIGDKKVILYNTHLTPFLEKGEEAINKIRSVFDCVKERNDILLLWRPHPLIKQTLFSMREELCDLYGTLEEEYKQQRIGIYDDSMDFYPAISAADAYYGDESSVVTLFGITGKPICLQKIDVINNTSGNMRDELCCESAAIVDGMIYFTNIRYNGLFRMNFEGECCFLGAIPQEDKKGVRLFSKIVFWEGNLWLIPLNGSNFVRYSLDTKEFKLVPIPACGENTGAKFFAGYSKGKYYYAVGCRYPGIVILDMESGSMQVVNDWVTQYDKRRFLKKEGIRFRQDCCQVGNSIFLACCRAEYIMEFELDTFKSSFWKVGDIACTYITIAYDGNNFWLTGSKDTITVWNKDADKVKELAIDICDFEIHDNYPFGNSLQFGGYIWLFSFGANKSIKVQISTGKMEAAECHCDISTSTKAYISGSFINNNKLYYIDEAYAKLNEVTEEGGHRRVTLCHSGTWDSWGYLHEDKRGDTEYSEYIHKEGDVPEYQLESYLDYIALRNEVENDNQKKAFLKLTSSPKGEAGEKIHKYVVDM